MRPEKFFALSPNEQTTLVLSMMVRNKMEDFHVENLTDKQMKELNPLIREGIMQGLLALQDKSHYNCQLLGFLGMMIPDYWEIPEEKLKSY
tara:strand:+ start:85 stop:357 length:273 start_codon:yes stop_codon:yes gene_type:complete